jgi:WD40 repeat protein
VRRHKKALWIDHHDTISVLAVGKGVLYSGSWDKTIKVWRVSDLKCVESIAAHIDAVNALAVDLSRGFLYSGSADGTVKVWERSRTAGVRRTVRHSAVATLALTKNQSVNALALSGDGAVCYAGSSDKCIAVWETHDEGTGKHMRNSGALRGHRLAVLCLASVSNVLVSGSADKTIRVWRRSPGAEELAHQCLAVLRGHSRPVKCLAARMEPRGEAMMVCSGSMDRSVRVWWLSLADHDGESAGDAPSSPDIASFLTPNESLFQPSLEPEFRQ